MPTNQPETTNLIQVTETRRQYLERYLLGKALEGAYSNLDLSRSSGTRNPQQLASHITSTVKSLLSNFTD